MQPLIDLFDIKNLMPHFTALISVVTAASTLWVIPLILKSPTTAQLQAELERNRQLDEERQQALDRLQKIASRVPGMVYQFQLNPDGSTCFPYASPAIYDIFRVTPEDVQSSADKAFATLHPEDYDQVVSSIMHSAESLTPWQHEFRVRFQDGYEHWLLGNALPEPLDNGAVLWNGFITDITERKFMEQQLRNNEVFAASILDSLPAHIAVLDADGTIVMVNKAWKRFVEQNSLPNTVQDVTGWNYLEGSAKGLTEADYEMMDILQATQAVLSGEAEIFRTEYPCHSLTEQRWFQMTVSPLQHTRGGVVITHENVTERKRVETQLRIAATVFESQEGMLITDANETILKVNQSFTNITGYYGSEVIGQTPRVLSSGRHDKAFYADMWQKLEESGAWQGEIWNRRKNGEIYPEWLTVFAVTANNGDASITHYVATHTDITERKRVEDDLRQSQMLLQTAQRAAKLGHYVFDIKSRDAIMWTNDAQFDDIFGLDEHFVRDLANLPLFIHPDDLDLVVENFQRTFDRGQDNPTDSMVHRVVRPKDGEQRWIAQWGYTFYDDFDHPVQQVGMIQDITERKTMEDALKASEAKFRSIIEVSPVPMVLNDGRDNLVYINPAFTQSFGYELDEIPTLAECRSKIYPDPDYRQQIATAWQARIEESEREHSPFKQIELNIRCKDGADKTVLASATAFQSFSDMYLVVLYDITARKQAESQLRISATVFESQEGMIITDANSIILNVNQAFTRITGYSASDVIGQTPRVLQSGHHDKAFYDEMWQSIQQSGSWKGEVWNHRKNGETYPERLSITAVKGNNGQITHYVATIADITERKATEEYINKLAFYDPLTQLPNRRLLHERLKHSLDVNRRTGKLMAVLMMDLDKFKAVNDTLGHAAGDELLIQVADRVKNRLREVDMVARLGGDEFVILLDNVGDYKQVARIAKAIIRALSRSFTLYDTHKVYIGASIGITLHPQHGDDGEALLDHADTALYHAKEQGRGCFAYFSEALTQKAHERLALESRLRRAIEQHELHIYFQPQIDINTGQLVGAEALVRWHDPVKGYLMPDEFSKLAEETGQIVAIGEWVLRETCKLGKKWLDQGFPAISFAVNVSPYQFRRCDMKSLVAKVLHETGFPAQYLELEINETSLMDDKAHTLPIFNSFHEQGVRLAIDGFGTGYSSLTSLKYLSINRLKIAKTFIDNIPVSQNDSIITSTIIAMAHNLGIKVLAEGVETLEQLLFLREHGCDNYQGYLYKEALSVGYLGFKALADVGETRKQLTFLREYSCDRYQGHLHHKILSTSEFAHSFNRQH